MHGILAPDSTTPFTSRKNNSPAAAETRIGQRFQEALAEATQRQDRTPPAPEPAAPQNRSYTIQQGDTLSEIVAAESKKSGLTHSRRDLYAMVNQVAEQNRLSNPDRIFPGQEFNLTSIHQPVPETVTRSVFDRIILPDQANGAEGGFQSPVNGRITSDFGNRHHPVLGKMLHHDGIDISRPTGTPVKPISSGIVTFSGNNGGYGQMVEIDHGDGLTSRYAHLSTLEVRKGEQILPGQIIGQVGETGLTTGPHLHLEIRRHNAPIDPLTVLHRHQLEDNLILAEARTSHRL
jgi:murein DD-endopeptidase MepM/ murein hydrolase activator NlpD